MTTKCLLENYLTANKAEREAHAHHLFSATLQQLKNHPYYKQYLVDFSGQNFSFDPSIPVLTGSKLAQLINANPLSLVESTTDIGITICSGGSTGKRKAITHSWDFFRRMFDLGVRAVQASSSVTPRSVANCFMAGDMSGAFTFGEGICEQLGVHYFPIGSKIAVDDLAEIIDDFKIDTLFCTPSFAYSLAYRLQDPQKFVSLKTIYYVGELMKDDDADFIQNKINVSIRSLSYTTSELGPIGYQCQHCDHDTYHLNEDAVFVEVVDPESHQVLPKETIGEVLVTTYLNTGTPFLRYNTGDLGIVYDSPCQCGSTVNRIKVLGRTKGSIKVCAFTLEKSLVMDVLSPLSGINESDVQITVSGNKVDVAMEIFLNSEKISDNEAITADKLIRKNYIFARIISQKELAKFHVVKKHRTEFNKSLMHKTPFFVVREHE